MQAIDYDEISIDKNCNIIHAIFYLPYFNGFTEQ